MSEESFDIYTYTVPCQHVREYGGATIDGNDHVLLLSVKKYVPRVQKQEPAEGVTILAAGGNGFSKVSGPTLFSNREFVWLIQYSIESIRSYMNHSGPTSSHNLKPVTSRSMRFGLRTWPIKAKAES